jgi:tetratricopeptide (TPR) repeat protein
LARAALFFAVNVRAAEATECARRVVAVDPLSAWGRFVAGTAFRLLRRYDDAIALCREALDLNPHHGLALTTLGAALLHRGDVDQAVEAYERAYALTGGNPIPASGLCIAYAARGEAARAETALAALIARHDAERPAGAWIAFAFGALGRQEEAFAWLVRAVEAREFWSAWLRADPFADPLRSDPRFGALLRRIGVPAR